MWLSNNLNFHNTYAFNVLSCFSGNVAFDLSILFMNIKVELAIFRRQVIPPEGAPLLMYLPCHEYAIITIEKNIFLVVCMALPNLCFVKGRCCPMELNISQVILSDHL